jgi:hypothetical protein
MAGLADFSGQTTGLPSLGGGGVGVGLGFTGLDGPGDQGFSGSPFDIQVDAETDEDLDAAAAEDVEEKKKRLRRGFAQTILTSPTGLGGVSESSKSILG